MKRCKSCPTRYGCKDASEISCSKSFLEGMTSRALHSRLKKRQPRLEIEEQTLASQVHFSACHVTSQRHFRACSVLVP